MNFNTSRKSYFADKGVCLKGHMLIETSSYFVQFDIWRRVSYFTKKFQTKNLFEENCKSEFHVIVQCFTTLTDIQGKRGQEKNLPEQRFVSTVGELSAQMRLGNGQISSSLSLD